MGSRVREVTSLLLFIYFFSPFFFTDSLNSTTFLDFMFSSSFFFFLYFFFTNSLQWSFFIFFSILFLSLLLHRNTWVTLSKKKKKKHMGTNFSNPVKMSLYFDSQVGGIWIINIFIKNFKTSSGINWVTYITLEPYYQIIKRNKQLINSWIPIDLIVN